MLVTTGPSGLRAGEIGEQLDIGATNLSFHLKELERAGLLRSTKEGRYVRYAVNIEGMRKLVVFLTEDCCQGQPELCGAIFSSAENLCSDDKGDPA